MDNLMVPNALLHDADLVGRHSHPPHLGGDEQRPLLGHNQEVAVRVVEACSGRSLMFSSHEWD